MYCFLLPRMRTIHIPLLFICIFLYVFVYFCMFLYVFVCFCMFLYVFVYFCIFLYIYILALPPLSHTRTHIPPHPTPQTQLSGVCRITLRPLVPKLPTLGAVTVSLMEVPDMEADIHIGDLRDLTSVPGTRPVMKYALEVSCGFLRMIVGICVWQNDCGEYIIKHHSHRCTFPHHSLDTPHIPVHHPHFTPTPTTNYIPPHFTRLLWVI